ncbi:MAG TPA: PAS domain S-box protein, partial [Gaiellaceae bacterium]|nr:PAS domain S-box protein [Gaiellaceae bacterium]
MSAVSARLLLVEDSPADAELILHELAREELVGFTHRVDTIEALQAALVEEWDIVISDDSLPGFGAAQTLELVAAADPTLPVIVVSGVLDEEAAVTHLRSGAKDFVSKSRLSRLNAAVRRELGAAQLVKAKRAGERAAAELSAIVASSSDAIYSTDLVGEITSWNGAATRVFGHTAAEMVGTVTDPTVAPADRGRHAALCARVAAGERPPVHETVRIAKDGTSVDTEVSIAAIRDELGKVVGISTSARDVTDQKQAARRLEEHDRAFAAIFEGANDAILIADDDGRYLGANRAAGVLLGLPSEALLGRTVGEFVMDGGGQFAEFLQTGDMTGTIALSCADGAVKLAEYSAAANILPGRHLSILRDVTERIEAERVQRESEAKFHAVFDNTRSAILLFDDDQVWLEGNPAAGRLFGLPHEELAGKRYSDFMEPGSELDTPFANVIELGEFEGDWTVVRP